jgi:hypothetical protein
MKTIAIREFCDDACITRVDGARLREAIVAGWDHERVVLDFAGTRIASVSFFDEAIGLLAREHAVETLTNRLEIVHLDPSDRALLNRIVARRAQERKAG